MARGPVLADYLRKLNRSDREYEEECRKRLAESSESDSETNCDSFSSEDSEYLFGNPYRQYECQGGSCESNKTSDEGSEHELGSSERDSDEARQARPLKTELQPAPRPPADVSMSKANVGYKSTTNVNMMWE